MRERDRQTKRKKTNDRNRDRSVCVFEREREREREKEGVKKCVLDQVRLCVGGRNVFNYFVCVYIMLSVCL